MKKSTAILLLSLCALPLPALAADLPADKRIRLLEYHPSDVYTLMTRYGYQSNIELERGEEIQTISVGDRSLWQIIPGGNRLFIRPLAEDLTTNMTLITNQRAYQFDLKSAPPGKGEEVVYVIRFVYDREAVSPAFTDTTPKRGNSAMRAVLPNYRYTFSGPDTLAPQQVYDDGAATFIRYDRLPQPVPRIFAVLPDGKKQPVDYNVNQSLITIDRVFGQFDIVSSGGVVSVFNEASPTP